MVCRCSLVAELTKFGICPKPEAMKCITVSIQAFFQVFFREGGQQKDYLNIFRGQNSKHPFTF